MLKNRLTLVAAVGLTCLVVPAISANLAQEDKAKAFSLFSVVQFENTACTSTSGLTTSGTTSSNRNGTCYASSECREKGGTAAGQCASGFGVCCVFLKESCGSTVNQNCTYIRNPSFPSVYSETSSCSYTVRKCADNVCFLRLDFESFNLLGPIDTNENDGTPNSVTCQDTFTVTGLNSGQNVPNICGQNTGQHIYVDLGAASGDSATLTFSPSSTADTTRTWEVKVTQVECNNPSRPPVGCLQYWTTLTGRMATFGFDGTETTGSHAGPLDYTQCIRRQEGYCCVEYSVCANEPMPFSLGQTMAVGAEVSAVGLECQTLDYISITGAGECNGNQLQNNLNLDRFCGGIFNFGTTTVTHTSVCQCNGPFEVSVYANAIGEAGAGADNAARQRGNCLEYRQIPC